MSECYETDINRHYTVLSEIYFALKTAIMPFLSDMFGIFDSSTKEVWDNQRRMEIHCQDFKMSSFSPRRP